MPKHPGLSHPRLVLTTLATIPLLVVLAAPHRLAGPASDAPSAVADVHAAGTASTSAPWFGLIAPTSSQLTSLTGSKVTRVTVSAAWDLLEPSRDVYSASNGAALAARVKGLRARGFQVVLDLGLQYPPSWVFSLPGPTRFIDQYGDQWKGATSTDVPNMVFDNNVRLAATAYIAYLAKAVGPGNIASIRVGGLLSGELRYPPSQFNGHSDLIWDYDTVAQSLTGAKGWKPGSGTQAQATAALSFYDNCLTNYLTWLMRSVNQSFPTVNQEILFPSWGIRPGQTQAAIASGMKNLTLAERNGTISAGLDWANQVKAIATTGINATVYTTWLDAPSQGTSSAQIPPVDYLAGLASTYGLPIAGENTGLGGASALASSLARVQSDHLVGMMYMSGLFISNGTAGISVNALISADNSAS